MACRPRMDCEFNERGRKRRILCGRRVRDIKGLNGKIKQGREEEEDRSLARPMGG